MENYLKERIDFLESNCIDIYINIVPANNEIEEAKRKTIRRLMLRMFASSKSLEDDEYYDLYRSYILDGFIKIETPSEDFDDMSRLPFIEGVISVLGEEAIKSHLTGEELVRYKDFVIKTGELLENERFHVPGMIKERNGKIPTEL